MPVSALISSRRRRGSLATIKLSEFNIKRASSSNLATCSIPTAVSTDEKEEEDNYGNNVKEFKRKSISTPPVSYGRNGERESPLAKRKNCKVDDDDVNKEEGEEDGDQDGGDDDEDEDELFSSRIKNPATIDLAVAGTKKRWEEIYYGSNNQQKQQQQQPGEQWEDDRLCNNEFVSGDDDDRRQEKQQLRKVADSKNTTTVVAGTLQRTPRVKTKTNECAQQNTAQTLPHRHYHQADLLEHEEQQQPSNKKLLVLDQLQRRQEDRELTADRKTMLLLHPLLLNEEYTPDDDDNNNNNNNTENDKSLLRNKSISDKWSRNSKIIDGNSNINNNTTSNSQGSCHFRWRTSTSNGERCGRNISPVRAAHTVKVANFVTTSSPVKLNKSNRIISCRRSGGGGASSKNKSKSSFCDNQVINKLISSEILLFRGVFSMCPWKSRSSNSSGKETKRRGGNNQSTTVFTFFNLVLVYLCLLLWIASCHQVNCLEVVVQRGGKVQQDGRRYGASWSSTSVSPPSSLSSPTPVDRIEKGGNGQEAQDGTEIQGSFVAVVADSDTTRNVDSLAVSSSAEITSNDSSFSVVAAASFNDFMYRGHSLDKRSIAVISSAVATDVDNNNESVLGESTGGDGSGSNSGNDSLTLSRDRNKLNPFPTTNGDSFNNVDGDVPPTDGGAREGADIDGKSNKDGSEPRESDDINNSRTLQNDSKALPETADGGESFLRVERNTIGKTNGDNKEFPTGIGGSGSTSNAGSASGKTAPSNEPSPFDQMSGEAPMKPHFFKNLSSSSSTPNKRGSRSVCRLSEFVCKGGKCISADKFCDGVDDCGDGSPSSDEPRFCTPCNRTYYGEVGSTYQISLSSETIAAALGLNHPQQVDPSQSQAGGGGHGGPVQFVCHLTFFAAGDNFGDLVQLMFDSVNIGQFVSSVMDGCPEGSLQVAEISRPITGGQWCGSGAGFSVYFSEMSTITLTLIVGGPSLAHSSKSSSQNSSLSSATRPIDAFPGTSRIGPIATGTHQSPPVIPAPPPPEFDFKMRYKFIPVGLAAVRYGVLGNPIERGQLEPGTYCNRILEQCHRRRCKIQSPNYPGLYPRNVSCFFTVRQRDKPQCKRFLIQVSQSRSHKVQLRSLLPGPQMSLASGLVMSPVAANDPTASNFVDTFMAWDDCNWSRDRIVIYDGSSTDAPILLSICGGSHIPPVTSSGPEIHIAFHSTPFGNPLGPVPPPPFPAPLRGFELDVDVILVDSESADYSNTLNCTFYFVSSKAAAKGHRTFKLQQEGGNWITGVTGHVSSPRHTLPPNTTCRYEFKGADNEAIWIYFVSYRRDSVKDSKRLPEGNCTTKLTIRDGLLGHGQPRALLGSFCDSELPKLCEHKALQNETRLVRACTTNESYISAGASLIVEQQFLEGTALRPLHYKFHYEFVNRHPAGSEGACSRHFHMGKVKTKKGTFRTTDNIFDFGRGGKRNLTCVYTFTMGTHDGLKLTVLRSSFGDRPCRTQTDLESGRYSCNYYTPSAKSGASPAGGSSPQLNDTLSALSNNMTYPPHHSIFASDHPGGNFTGSASGGGTAAHHHPYRPRNFPRSELTLEEYIWPGVNITSHKNCICSNSSRSSGYSWTFLGRKVQLTFNIENMKGQDGYENFFVELEYEILKGEGCRGDNHYMKTESGLISLESYFSYGPRDKPPTCDHYPWLLEAKENHSLYLRIPGFAMLEEKKRTHRHQPKLQGLTLYNLTGLQPQAQHGDEHNSASSQEQHLLPMPFTANSLVNSTAISTKPSSTGSGIFQIVGCPTTKNRIFVYDRDNRLVQKICPSSNHQMSKKNIQVVELYSEEFYQFTSPLYPPPRPRFIIEFVGRELGTYRINWLEVMSARMKTTLKAMQTDFEGKATTAGRRLGANYSDVHKKELPKITSSWGDTLTAMFEGQNELDHVGGQAPPPKESGGDSVLLVDERPPPVCSSYCPELRACISEKLWCDGEIHCPVTKMDEISCDSFWLTLGQLMSPAVYVPLLAAVVSALCCCVLVMLCVGVKKMILSSRFKRHRHHHHHRPGSADGRSSMGSSCTSTVDRRTLPPRDWTLDPHDPLS